MAAVCSMFYLYSIYVCRLIDLISIKVTRTMQSVIQFLVQCTVTVKMLSLVSLLHPPEGPDVKCCAELNNSDIYEQY